MFAVRYKSTSDESDILFWKVLLQIAYRIVLWFQRDRPNIIEIEYII